MATLGPAASRELRRLYKPLFSLHRSISAASDRHRKQHGEGVCLAYPSSSTSLLSWPLLLSITKARRILEVGCGLGFAAAVLAELAGPEARIDTIEKVDIHADLAERELARAGLAGRVRVLRGDAQEVLSGLRGRYGLVFVDADPHDYPDLLSDLARLVRPHGFLVTANLSPLFESAWSGGRLAPLRRRLRTYLGALLADRRFRTYVIPHKWHAMSYRLPLASALPLRRA